MSQSNSNTSQHKRAHTEKEENACRNNLSQSISILVSKEHSRTSLQFTGHSLISWTFFPVCSVEYLKTRLFILKLELTAG